MDEELASEIREKRSSQKKREAKEQLQASTVVNDPDGKVKRSLGQVNVRYSCPDFSSIDLRAAYRAASDAKGNSCMDGQKTGVTAEDAFRMSSERSSESGDTQTSGTNIQIRRHRSAQSLLSQRLKEDLAQTESVYNEGRAVSEDNFHKGVTDRRETPDDTRRTPTHDVSTRSRVMEDSDSRKLADRYKAWNDSDDDDTPSASDVTEPRDDVTESRDDVRAPRDRIDRDLLVERLEKRHSDADINHSSELFSIDSPESSPHGCVTSFHNVYNDDVEYSSQSVKHFTEFVNGGYTGGYTEQEYADLQLDLSAISHAPPTGTADTPTGGIGGSVQSAYSVRSRVHDDAVKEAWSTNEDFLLALIKDKLRKRNQHQLFSEEEVRTEVGDSPKLKPDIGETTNKVSMIRYRNWIAPS